MDEANARASVALRAGTPTDATALTDVFLAAMLHAVPGLPLAHTRAEIIVWMRERAIQGSNVTVAEIGGVPAGFIRTEAGWIHQLFVAPVHHRIGVGSALISPVLQAARAPVRLWAFQRNAIARAFYERKGFAAELFTDGATNEERTPDVLYVWRPSR